LNPYLLLRSIADQIGTTGTTGRFKLLARRGRPAALATDRADEIKEHLFFRF
jgi:hypothetical protein